MVLCHVCGNSVDTNVLCCPYCNAKQEPNPQSVSSKAKFSQKTVNLEQGLPTVEQALARLKRELDSARHERIRVMTLIHGYGSTGKGGAIRLECRKTLAYLARLGEIHTVIHGEDFNRRHGSTKHLLGRFHDLAHHPHLNHNNRGITLIQMY
jgi:hypothetical protein